MNRLTAFGRALFDAMLQAPKAQQLVRARGLGGWRLERIGDVRLDKRQKKGVPLLRAHLIDRNKYQPHLNGGRWTR